MIVVGGIAIAIATAQIREGGSVRTVRARVVVRSVARIIARLKAMEARVAIVGALIQDRRDRRDARPGASFAILRYLDDHCSLACTTERKSKIESYIINLYYDMSFLYVEFITCYLTINQHGSSIIEFNKVKIQGIMYNNFHTLY